MSSFQSVVQVDMPDLRGYADAVIGEFVKEVTFGVEREAKELILSGSKSGKTYRRAKVTRKASARLKRDGFRTYKTAKGNERAIVGYEFHRASAAGEAPANDSGTLVKRIRGRMINNYRGEIEFGTEYAAILEETLNRPYIKPAIERALEKAQPILS